MRRNIAIVFHVLSEGSPVARHFSNLQAWTGGDGNKGRQEASQLLVMKILGTDTKAPSLPRLLHLVLRAQENRDRPA